MSPKTALIVRTVCLALAAALAGLVQANVFPDLNGVFTLVAGLLPGVAKVSSEKAS